MKEISVRCPACAGTCETFDFDMSEYGFVHGKTDVGVVVDESLTGNMDWQDTVDGYVCKKKKCGKRFYVSRS